MGRRRPKKRGIQQRVKELEEYCNSPAPTLEGLKEKTERVPPETIAGSSFLHTACMNKGVTHDVIRHLLDVYPEAAGNKYEGDEIYPLHVACLNRHCPGSVIRLLVESKPDVLSVISPGMGLPLMTYMLRRSKYDLSTVEYLVQQYPEALTTEANLFNICLYTPIHLLCEVGQEISLSLAKLLVDEERKCLSTRGGSHNNIPVALLLSNSEIVPPNIDVVRFLIEHKPSFSLAASINGGVNALHAACFNKSITLEMVQVLLDIESVVREESPIDGSTAIHILCQNAELDDDTSAKILQLLMEACPGSISKRSNNGYLPIHHACKHKSFECCKLLIDGYPDGVLELTMEKSRRTPFHLAVEHGTLELVEYLFELHPSSISKSTCDEDFNYDEFGNWMDETEAEPPLQIGDFPLHIAAASSDNIERGEIVQFILEHHKDAAKSVGKWGRLPLHEACASSLNLGVVKSIFRAYPKAIHTEDIFGRLPIHYAMGARGFMMDQWGKRQTASVSSNRQTERVLGYLFKQLPYSLEAEDNDGRVCAHFAAGSGRALQKLRIIEREHGCDTFYTLTEKYGLPVHVACRESERVARPIDVVEYLEKMAPRSLNSEISLVGLPLGHAMKPDIFQYLLSSKYPDTTDDMPAFHRICLDEDVVIKGGILGQFIRFSSDEYPKIHDFQKDVWRLDKRGAYPLHHIFNTVLSKRTIEELIDLHPEALQKRDNRGWLPLHHALSCDKELEKLQLLVDKHPDSISARDNQGLTPMHVAASAIKSEETLRWLHAQYPEAMAQQDRRGWLPLHYALRNNPPFDVIKWMVLCIDGVFRADAHGCTPVHVACRHGTSSAVVCFLIELDATALTTPDNRGELPLHKACRGGHAELIKEVMAANASTVTERNALNELPISILCKRSGKDKEVLESVEYTEAIWQLLLAHPEALLEAKY